MNNKSIFERVNNIMNRGPEKWLSRSLREDAIENARNDSLQLSQISDKQKQQVKDVADKAFGLGNTPKGTPRKREEPANIDGNKLAKNVAKAGGAKLKNVSYDPEKDLSPEPTQKQEETGPIVDSNLEQKHNSLQEEHQRAIKEHVERMKKILDEKNSIEDSVYGPLRESLQKLQAQNLRNGGTSSDDQKQQFLNMIAYAQTYPGKFRSGDAQQMMWDESKKMLDSVHQQSLLQSYGDGSPEQIKSFIDSRKVVDTDPELVKSFYDALPDNNAFKKYLNTAGKQSKGVDIFDPETGKTSPTKITKNYQGKDEEGNAIYGSGGESKALILFKRYLDQMGMDGYTGMPLDPRFMDLEHVRGTGNKVDDPETGTRAPSMEEFLQREHEDNWLWISAGMNNKKAQGSMQDLIDRVEKTRDQVEKGEEHWPYNNIDAMQEVSEKKTGMEAAVDGLFQQDSFAEYRNPTEPGERQKPASKLKDFNEETSPEIIDGILQNELDSHLLQKPKAVNVPQKGLARKMWQQLGLPTSFQTNGNREWKEGFEILRPMIMNLVNERDTDKRQNMIKSFMDVWGPRRRAAIDAAGGKDVDEQFIQDRDKNTKDGKLNINGFFKEMMRSGLLGMENPLITKEDLENSKYFPSEKQRKILRGRYSSLFEGEQPMEEEVITWMEELELHVNAQLAL